LLLGGSRRARRVLLSPTLPKSTSTGARKQEKKTMT
jgi:hypothetical protein